jgi:membrane fusion protein (multidrug efflux system)
MKIKLIILFLASLMALISCGDDSNEGSNFVPEIQVFEIKGETIPIYTEFVARISGQKDIAIRARVEGFLEGIHFEEGFPIKKGDLLYTIESQPFEESVAARLSELAAAQTQFAKAESDLNRYKPLAKKNAVSQSDLDAAVAQYKAAEAMVDAAEANVRAARINLSYTTIRSPIDGIIGKTKAKVGDFVGREPNPVILNVVSSLDTILADFFLTENDYLLMIRKFQEAEDKFRDEDDRYILDLILADGTTHPFKGKIDFLDREIDPTTGSVLVQCSFPNPNNIIRPGQFGKVKGQLTELKNGIKIPQRCIMELQGQKNVYIIDSENKIELRNIMVGPKIDNFIVVREGLEIGEKIVYEGLQKVRPQSEVKPIVTEVKPISSKIK